MPTTLNLALMACLLCVRLEAQQSAGFVLDMDGIWTSAGSSQPLSRGQHLPAGALLRNDSPSNGDRIVVANLNGEVVKRIRCKSGVCKECNDSGACNDPIRALPSATPQAGALASSFEAVMELFLGKPDRYSAHRVRGEGLAEAVLQLADGRCDLAPAFRNVDKGRYYIQFKSLSEPGSASGIGFDPLPFDADASRAYGRVYAAVVASGRKARGARAVDLLIAATACAAGLPLYTRNPADFSSLADLVDVVGV